MPNLRHALKPCLVKSFTRESDALAFMQPLNKSIKLNNVCYDIRGPVLQRARQMEDEGHRIIKLNIGNPAAFGLRSPKRFNKIPSVT
jgi:hypothetical protein